MLPVLNSPIHSHLSHAHFSFFFTTLSLTNSLTSIPTFIHLSFCISILHAIREPRHHAAASLTVEPSPLSLHEAISFYRNYGKTFKESRSSYGKGFLDAELKFIGGYELRCKRELWSVQMSLAALQKYFSSLMRRTLSRLLVVEVFLGE